MMDRPTAAQTFRARLRAREPLIGTWVKTPSHIVAEVLALTSLDCLCLDAEHAPFGRLDLDACIAVCRAAGKPVLVRTPSADPAHIQNALDLGATGILVPHVTDRDTAEAVARAAHFGACGRGYAGSTRAAGYTRGTLAGNLAAAGEGTTVIAMIEDAEAVDKIEAILAAERIDCFFIGRIDLTVSLGATSPADPRVVAAVERICAAAAQFSRPVGMFVPDSGEIARWKAASASLFLQSSDHGFLLDGAERLAAMFCPRSEG